jgi:A/G-specific adenine glycosylase
MLQQTKVATVIPYYHEWLLRFPDFATLARASKSDVLRAWQGLGYYARARNLHSTARIILDRHHGRFPRAIEQMRRFPGIGKYTSHALASFAFNRPVPIVEANTARVLARLFNFRESIDSAVARKTLWRHAAGLLPKSGASTFNSALLDLGALVCVARKPKCDVCPVKAFCRTRDPEMLPVKKSRRQTKLLIETHALIVRRSRILLEQSSHRWRGMWILPPLEVNCKRSGFRTRPIYQSVFPFTYHRVTLAVYRRRAPKQIAPQQQWFVSTKDAAMPSPHRRALDELLHRKGDSQCNTSSTRTPAAVVRSVVGIPTRA